MKEKIYTGSGVAIITPFKGPNLEQVDFDKFGELIEFQIQEGTDAIIVCGTTGEASTMPDAEHLSVIEYAVEKVGKRVPVIAGAGSNDTLHAIRLSQKCEELGADGLLSVTPYYNKTTQKGLCEHFRAIAESVSLPIILYNVPGRTGLNIDPATMETLARIPNINAVKECNFLQIPEIVKRCGDELNLYTGEDGQVYLMLAAGGAGVISVLANVAPKFTHDMIAEYFAGNQETSWKMQLSALDLIKALFCEVNPIPVKEAVNMMGWDVGACRLPLVPMSDANRQRLYQEMKNFGLIKG